MKSPETVDAIALLEEQHHEVDALFEALEKKGADKRLIFNRIADALAVHATIEEKIFYPMVKAASTEDILLESLEEHLGIKRLIADLLRMSPSDQMFEAKCTVLKEQVQHHVGEERSELFPKVRRLVDKAQLLVIGEQMAGMALETASTNPRLKVPSETAKAPAL